MRAALADRRPLIVPAFRRWWVASLVTAVGGSFSVVAVPAQLYAMTGTSAALGGSAVLSFAGLVIGALTAGTLADRWDRRVVLLAAQSGLAATYAGLWVQASLHGPLPILLVLVTCQGLTFGAISTTAGAVLPRLLPAELLAAANSLNSLVRYGGWILGPLLGGLLIPVAGLSTLYLCDAAALLAVLWAVLRLPPMPPTAQTPRPAASSASGDGSGVHSRPVAAAGGGLVQSRPAASSASEDDSVAQSWPAAAAVECRDGSVAQSLVSAAAGESRDGSVARSRPSTAAGGSRDGSVAGVDRSARAGRGLRGGLRHLRTSRLLMAVLAVDLAAMVLGMPVVLFPELARHTYGDPVGGGPVLGLFYAAYPAGVIMAGLFSGTFTRVRRPGRTMAFAAMAWGTTVILLGLTTHLWVALAALVLGGAVNFVLSTHRNAITQAHTDDALLGRVQGLLTVVLTGGPQLANLLHGAAGALIGPRPAIIAGGLLTVVAVAATLRASPELSTVEQTRQPAA
ncbi:MFS transporter [Actinoplanes xinjiangensis]|uniref:MFS transporter n=1 Tax=Actinoplanes xinjiangensis TaxID=512350 RepID=UPI003421E3BF